MKSRLGLAILIVLAMLTVAPATAYDITSPNGKIGINTLVEERPNIISGERLYIDIYYNNTLLFSMRAGVKQENSGDASIDWIDCPLTLLSKSVEINDSFRDLIVSVQDNDNNKTMSVRIRVFNNSVFVRFESIYNSSYYNTHLQIVNGSSGFRDTEVIAPVSVNNFWEDTLGKTTINNMASNAPPFVMFPHKHVIITQATLTVAPLQISPETLADGNYGITISNWLAPFYIPTNCSDWVGFIIFNKLNGVYFTLKNATPTFVKVKKYNRSIERYLNTYEWYKTDINDNRVRNEADVAVNMSLDGLMIDDGWQVGTSATQVDSSKFPNWLETINYVKNKGLKVGIHVYFEGIINDGIDNCITTWKNWGINHIKIGFWSKYITDGNANPYTATQQLRQLLEKLYQNGFEVSLHEIRIWSIPFEYENVLGVEAYPEGNLGSYWNFIEHFALRVVDLHNPDLNEVIHEFTASETPTKDSGTIFATLFAVEFTGNIAMEEWNGLNNSTKSMLEHIFKTKEVVNEIYYYDDKVVGIGENVVFAIALTDTNVSLNIPFDSYRVKDKSVSAEVKGIKTISLKAGEGVVYINSSKILSIVPVSEVFAPPSLHIGKKLNISVRILNLEQLHDYSIQIDLGCDGSIDLETKDTNITLPSFAKPSKYEICVYVLDPISGTTNKTHIQVQAYSYKLYKGYNIMNITGATIHAETSEPVHATVKPISTTSKEFEVIVNHENIYANKSSEVILNITFIGLAGGSKLWLNETVINAKTVDLLHNGKPLYTAIPVKNKSVNLTLTTFSTYTLVVNNTSSVSTPTPTPTPTLQLTLIVAILSVMLLAIVIYFRSKIKHSLYKDAEFKFFRRL